MKTALLFTGLAASLMTAATLYAQETKPDSKPATTPARASRPAPLISPELNADGSVTFRCRAPKATEVKVSGQFGKETTMTKGDDGTWSATISSVPPGVHEYHFSIDGVSVIDSQNPWIKPQRWPNTSILHVPSNPPAPWDLQDIPHGTLHLHDYKAKALDNKWRHLVVYTPPGEAVAPLPVLYLAHGFSDNDGSWSVHGKAHWILDSLIAQKKALPMIVVMPDAHPLPPGPDYPGGYGRANTSAFCKELVTDMIPLIESNYKVSPKPEARAFAGLSMGGQHAITVALTQYDTFNWVGAFSAGIPPTDVIADGLGSADKVNSSLKLFWIGCGKNDFLFKPNNEFTATLKEKGIHYQYEVTEGDHSWPVWRKYLIELAPKLFR